MWKRSTKRGRRGRGSWDLRLGSFPLKDDLGTNAHRPGKIRKNKEAIENIADAYEFLLYNWKLDLSRFFFLFPGGLKTSQGCGTGYRGTWSFWSCRHFLWPGRSIEVNNFLGAFNLLGSLVSPSSTAVFPNLDIRSFVLLGIRFTRCNSGFPSLISANASSFGYDLVRRFN